VIPYRCYLSDGSKDVVNHTPEQMIAVVQALGILLSTSIVKANNLKKSIAAATTQIELDAIVW
ncbi:MAG TPA: hypothetical protein DEA44_09130, partial [Firmicutes bacterium]|nr:hypothetical protein [Bacillota bacterium]